MTWFMLIDGQRWNNEKKKPIKSMVYLPSFLPLSSLELSFDLCLPFPYIPWQIQEWLVYLFSSLQLYLLLASSMGMGLLLPLSRAAAPQLPLLLPCCNHHHCSHKVVLSLKSMLFSTQNMADNEAKRKM